MPSFLHEGLVELFRNRPVLAVEMLVEALGLAVPGFTEARIEPADLSEIIPRELRADLVVLLLDDRPVLVIVVEAQLQFDPDKPFVWPCYVVGARARYRCPACLLVVTPDAALTRRLSQPIALGPGGFALPMFVLGPTGVPVVTDIPEAMKRPELAVLSAVAHGQTEVALEVAVAALAASAGLDEERGALYGDLVLSSLSEAARRALEELKAMRNYEYQSEFARKYFAQGLDEGRKEGRLEGELKPLVHQFERRLARALTPSERAILVERLREQGAERVGDVVLDLSPEDLATWLAASNGH
ncbi:hypothetical protein [Polyangium aurulentum]|uniref:hypothetical protein n=1 Tax=Polyangium aurulentum TaxID=2567896 RepID=UPI0010AEE012|nr:hypothetical protein [Polyangium aurulentum]UQA55796.1 hypothetical protein E8A73_031255 [Polyangium aurulentum]